MEKRNIMLGMGGLDKEAKMNFISLSILHTATLQKAKISFEFNLQSGKILKINSKILKYLQKKITCWESGKKP